MIRVTRVKERKDGSATIEFTYTKGFAEVVRNYYGKKRVSKKLIQKFVKEALNNYVKKYEKVYIYDEDDTGNVSDLERGIK